MKKWKDKSLFGKVLHIFVWFMIIASIGGVILSSASALFMNN